MASISLSIKKRIYEIRGQKVMLDRDLAELYGVEVRTLNQAVKRKIERFPAEFMFQLTADEWENQRSQFVIFKKDTRKYRPFAFTEHGILMLSSVLNSDKAIAVNIQIMRTFVQLRRYILAKSDTNAQIAGLRKLLLLYIKENDERVSDIIIALNNLLEQPTSPTKRIGFNAD